MEVIIWSQAKEDIVAVILILNSIIVQTSNYHYVPLINAQKSKWSS